MKTTLKKYFPSALRARHAFFGGLGVGLLCLLPLIPLFALSKWQALWLGLGLGGFCGGAFWTAFRFRFLKNEIRTLYEQLEKSTRILVLHQEKSKKIGEKIDSLHIRILMSKQQLESTFDAISDGICVLGPDLSIQRVNRAYSAMVKAPIRDLLGRKCYHVFWHSKTPCAGCPTLEALRRGEVLSRQPMTRSENDRTYYYEMSSYPIRDDQGRIVNIIESVHDVTEQKQMTEQLLRSEKLSTIGIMTAGIAHEMNNPLSGISGNASNMLQMPEKYGLNERAVLRLRSMLEASERATHIMRSLLDLSRHDEGQLIYADINTIIENALTKIHMPGYQKIRKDFHRDARVPPLRCDPSKIEQVFLNLFTNACYAVQERKLRLEAESAEASAAFTGILSIATQMESSRVRVVVEDNGVGIPEEKKESIFDPFFTTRPPGQGTGLGLSISHKIISGYGGRIWAENGKIGAQFIIELPLQTLKHG